MKKSTKLSAILLVLCLSLCACQKSNNLPEPPSSVAEISDPFGEISNDSQLSSDPSSSIGNKTSSSQDESEFNEDEEIQKDQQRFNEAASQIQRMNQDIYWEKVEWVDNETLKIPIKLEGIGNPETKLCPLIFCDGKLVQTSIDGKNFGHSECRINFAEESDNPENITHEIYLKPIFDSRLTSHYIALGYIVNPDERPDDYWMVSGMLVQSETIGWDYFKIDEEHKGLCIEAGNILEAAPSVPLTEELKTKYQLYEDNATLLNLDDPADLQTFSQDGKHHDNIILAENSDKAKFSVIAATNQPQRTPYRVTFLVNHKPVKFNGGYDHLDLTLEGGKISETEIEIDGLTDKDIVYAAFWPMPEALTGHENFEITDVHLVEGDK